MTVYYVTETVLPAWPIIIKICALKNLLEEWKQEKYKQVTENNTVTNKYFNTI